MGLLEARATFAPAEYPQALAYNEKAHQSHWLPSRVDMTPDIHDYKVNLSAAERHLIEFILKGFTQTEVFVQEYWSSQVSNWFKKPEIQIMSSTFAAFEGIHAVAYAYLNQSLNLENFDAFMHEPTVKAKIDRLMETRGRDKASIARSLAVFSAFNEGVSLFSSFAILLNFSRFGKMVGVRDIVGWSSRDENSHADAGCWLFREFIHEYPEIWTPEFREELYEAARLTIQLEDDFIEKAFSIGPVQGLTIEMMQQFIRHKCNLRLKDLTLQPLWNDLDKNVLSSMHWFDTMITGTSKDDFLTARTSAYAKGNIDFTNIF